MQCPKCGHLQDGGPECNRCGVIFSKLDDGGPAANPGSGLYDADADTPLSRMFVGVTALLIEQEGMDMVEALVGFERANEYSVADQSGMLRGSVVERGRGFAAGLMRNIVGSHRPLHMIVFDRQNETVLEADRPFFLILSTMTVRDASGNLVGTVRRRFTLLGSRYSLTDHLGREFATIRKPWFRIWKFPLFDRFGRESGFITKKWSGYWRESISDHDRFAVELGTGWTDEQKALVLATAISIDFDFFENNQRR